MICAFEKNGLMEHSQSMKSTEHGHQFPDCIELQLLGEHNIKAQSWVKIGGDFDA